MLVLTRRISEALLIGLDIKVAVLDVKGNKIRLGIVAPSELPIRRAETNTPDKERPPSGGQ